VPKEERTVLLEQLYPIINGRIKDMVLKHDAVRAVQTAIKYSTREQRKEIAKELQGTYAQLAESRYAKFLIGKLLVQDDDEIRDLIIPEFYGKVRKLINHPEASWILDDVYRGVATTQQKAHLLREWYGPEFSLFKSADSDDLTADLSKILEKEPAKKPHVMNDLFQMINSLIQKKMTGFTMLHDAMLQYFLNLAPESEDYKNFVETIKEDENGDLLKNMAFTQSGARLVCLLLAHGNAKDRKQILKTFKDTYQLMAGDKHGHRVILTAYDVVDDTVLTSKTIFSEILGKNEETDAGNIVFLANDLNARTTIMYLFEGMSRALFPPSHKADLELLTEIQAVRQKTSKKDAEVRRKELVTALSPQLIAAIEASADALVTTSFGCQFVTDALLSTVGDKEKALQAIAATAAGDPDAPVDEEAYPPQRPHISNEQHAGRMFKTLVAGGRFDKATGKAKLVDPPLNFADVLYPVIKEHVVAWATGASSFVVLALLEAEDFSDAKKLMKTLVKNAAKLKKAATEETAQQKAMREAFAAKEADGKGAKGGNKKPKKAHKEHEVGNMGSKLLLEKLQA
jgi:pumilio family protein 6